MLKLKRVYDAPSRADGYRLLVDRLWPRGLSKDKARIDAWLKEVAPSDALRKWFGHDPERWPEFRARYREELRARREALSALRGLIKEKRAVTLLFAASDEARNNAAVLAQILKTRRPRSGAASRAAPRRRSAHGR